MRTKISLFILIGFLLVTSCSLIGLGMQEKEPASQENQGDTAADGSENAEIANPASVYCVDQGYTLELRTKDDGSMYGVCIFPNGNECEEWAFFHGQCAPASERTDPDTPQGQTIPDGWQTYTNDRYGYQISYPPQATITASGVMGYPTEDLPEGMEPGEYMTQLEAQYGDDLCLTINYNQGYITVLPDWENSFNYNACGRTGVGVGDMLDTSAAMTINGQAYTAEGFEWHGTDDQQGEKNETLKLILSDGTHITFGGPLEASVDFAQYLAETRHVLLSIIETYAPHQ